MDQTRLVVMCSPIFKLNIDIIFIQIKSKLVEKKKKVNTTKFAHQIFDVHKIYHNLFNSQPILMIKCLKFT